MDKITIIYSKDANKFLKRAPQKQKSQIITAIKKYPKGYKPLKKHINLKSLRIGNVRVISTKKGQILDIVDIGNRGQIYNRY